MRICHRFLVLTTCVAINACSGESHRDTAQVEALDAAEVVDLSPEELTRNLQLASSGDLASARRVYDFYSVREAHAKAKYWEDILIQKGDPSFVRMRAENMFRRASKLEDGSEEKLRLLEEAANLANRIGGKPETPYKVLVNGRYQLVDHAESNREFARKVRTELTRVSELQRLR